MGIREAFHIHGHSSVLGQWGDSTFCSLLGSRPRLYFPRVHSQYPPGKNTGVGYHVLLQGIFLTVHFQGELLNRFSLRDRDLLPSSNFRPKIKVIRTHVKTKKNLATDAS